MTMKQGDTLRRSDGKEFTVRDARLMPGIVYTIVAPDGTGDQVEAHSKNTEGDVFVSVLHGHIYTFLAKRNTLRPPSPSEVHMQAVAYETINAYENAIVCAGCMTALWRTDSCPVCEE